MLEYYDRSGRQIHEDQWLRLFSDPEYKQVRVDTVRTPGRRKVKVSTIWLGLNHGWGGDVLIFETCTFAHSGTGRWDQYMERYTTEEEAIEGHHRIIGWIREGKNPYAEGEEA